MKPLHVNSLKEFLARFESFAGSEIKAITIQSPTVMSVRISVQDSGRGFDWIDVNLECSNVSDAKLLEESKLSFLDMQEGVNIFFDEKKYVLSYGNYCDIKSAKDSLFYIICDSIKFEELPFSG